MKSFFDRLKASLAKSPLPHIGREKRPLLSPQTVPAIIGRAPQDFALYSFESVTLVTIKKKDTIGTIIRQRGLVACMVLREQAPDGAIAQIEMLVSLADLKNGAHPQLQKIEMALMDIYTNRLHKRISAPVPQTTASRSDSLHEDFLHASREKLSFLLSTH